jgi:hypothetical protein
MGKCVFYTSLCRILRKPHFVDSFSVVVWILNFFIPSKNVQNRQYKKIIFKFRNENAKLPNKKRPKCRKIIGHFVDPSIAVASLGIGPNDLINDLHTMGLFFRIYVY